MPALNGPPANFVTELGNGELAGNGEVRDEFFVNRRSAVSDEIHATGNSGNQPVSLIDWNLALRKTEGDEALVRDIVSAFLEEYPQVLDNLRRAVFNSDAKLLLRAAHTLKNTASFFGAPPVVEVATELELMGRKNQLSAAAERLATLEEHADQLVAELKVFAADGDAADEIGLKRE